MPYHDNTHRFAANHHRGSFTSKPMVGKGGKPSPAVDAFRPISAAAAANVAYLGSRGRVSPAVGYGAPFDSTTETVQDFRGLSQGRLLSEADRRRIDGARIVGAHPAIGRSLVSPIVILGGSDY